ncbi:MAG: glycine--tRNA ligase subunit beta [Candidatus Erginobacter occultus]|nr:glycine--tRNA ligase subunit beta [Candidatus Erginobacter occultus]
MAERRKNFLLEIGTEELPPSFLGPALEQLRAGARELSPTAEASTLATPRRLVLHLAGLPLWREETVFGPPLERARDEKGNWNRQALGFARGRGKQDADLRVAQKKGRDYCALTLRIETAVELAEAAGELIARLGFPKSMRWLTGDPFRFGRPIRWLLCLFGSEVLPVSAAGLRAGRETRGLRFFAPEGLKVPRADLGEFQKLLRDNYVLADSDQRKKKIEAGLLRQLRRRRPAAGPEDIDSGLLEEVAGLVEYPRIIRGGFERRFLSLPAEVLVTVMRVYQRYFPVFRENGELAEEFLLVANGPFSRTAAIRKNNQKVLRARLADAEFFWREDLARPLEDRLEELDGMVFYRGLGTYRDKTRRLVPLSAGIARRLEAPAAEIADTERAALLAKTDLVTAMVREFTDLQGVMGGEYARRQGEGEGVAIALREQYLPRRAEDPVPRTRPGMALALADRLDTLAAFFSAGFSPSGSSDPYGLRRQAGGVVRILAERELSLPVAELVEEAVSGLAPPPEATGKLKEEIAAFIRARLEAYLEGRGFPTDMVRAVFAAGGDDLPGAVSRIETLEKMRGSKELLAAATVVERTANIVREAGLSGKEAWRDGPSVDPAERNLARVYAERGEEIRRLIEKGDYRKATSSYARVFSRPLSDFFDRVLVNVEDDRERKNRMILLKKINLVYTESVADLSLLQFERGEHILE